MRPTHQLLKKTPDQYELLIFSLWLDWCQRKTHSEEQLHRLLSNNALFKWWRANLETLERIFSDDVVFYYEITEPEVLETVYREYTRGIFSHYSKILIKKAITNINEVNNDRNRTI